MKKTIVAHVPSNHAGFELKRLLQSLSWTDALVVHDASADGSVSSLARSVRADVVCVLDRNPDIRMRLVTARDATPHDYVLWAQSDEVWEGTVVEEILALLAQPDSPQGMIVRHESFNFGTSFGIGWPQTRVVDRKSYAFHTDDMHEMPSVPGKTIELASVYKHYPNQNMLVNWIKNYKYMITQSRSDVRRAHRTAWSRPQIPLLTLTRYLLRLNYRLACDLWAHRKLGFAGVCMAHLTLIRVIVAELVPEEVARLDARGEEYESAGHTHFR